MHRILAILAAAAALTVCRAADGPPQVTYQEPPVYPFSMRLSGNKGKVVLDFIVDPHGNVVRIGVVSSSHPDFEAPAVEALLKWRFRPGVKGGVPVFVHMQVPIIFQLIGAPHRVHTAAGFYSDEGDGAEVWSVPERPPATFPERFQYDRPPKPLVTSAPVYPFELLAQNVTGKASVTFAIDPLGRPHVVKLQSASRPEFGQAVTAMIEAWTFEPAMKKGAPCWALLAKEEAFDRHSRDFPLNESAERLLRLMKKDPAAILSTQEQVAALDAPLKARFCPSPVMPDDLAEKGSPQSAVIEFIIDHAGHAQLPRVVSASEPSFGWAAATAVARWQYTIPSLRGRPVDVRIRVPFAFSGPKGPSDKS